MKKKILKAVSRGKVTPSEAFSMLYGPKKRRGNFVKISVNITESKVASVFANILFIMPIPIVFGKYFIKKALKKRNMPQTIYEDIVSSLGGTYIHVDNKDANIKVKIF